MSSVKQAVQRNQRRRERKFRKLLMKTLKRRRDSALEALGAQIQRKRAELTQADPTMAHEAS